jgi:mannobiose 2-epimerase
VSARERTERYARLPLGVLYALLHRAGLVRVNAAPRGPVWTRTLRERVMASAGLLERLLCENIVPFWTARVVDEEAGGYRLNHDIEGRWQGPACKRLIAETRTLWFFARLARSPYGTANHLEIARHGFRFLRERLWDPEHGGGYWEVDAHGKRTTKPDKHAIAQAFVIFAAAEYACASGDAAALQLARDAFQLLEEHFHDPVHGGYQTRRGRAFEEPEPDVAWTKSGGDHIHLLEALTTFHRVTRDSLARERLLELMGLLADSLVNAGTGTLRELHRRDWTPVNPGLGERISYGHDLENAWFLSDAAAELGADPEPLGPFVRMVHCNALRFGFDPRGGYFEGGLVGAPAHRRNKIWWAQAESLVALLDVYARTGEDRYAQAYLATLEWIDRYQADWERGEWYAVIGPDGRASGIKAGPWKTGYHNGRAMIECLERLQRLPDPSA